MASDKRHCFSYSPKAPMKVTKGVSELRPLAPATAGWGLSLRLIRLGTGGPLPHLRNAAGVDRAC